MSSHSLSSINIEKHFLNQSLNENSYTNANVCTTGCCGRLKPAYFEMNNKKSTDSVNDGVLYSVEENSMSITEPLSVEVFLTITKTNHSDCQMTIISKHMSAENTLVLNPPYDLNLFVNNETNIGHNIIVGTSTGNKFDHPMLVDGLAKNKRTFSVSEVVFPYGKHEVNIFCNYHGE